MRMLAGTDEVISRTITITKYSTHRAARCDCRWVTVDQRRFDAKVIEHVRLHQNRDGIQVTYRERNFGRNFGEITIGCGRKKKRPATPRQ